MNRNQNQKNQLRAFGLMLAPVWVGFQAFKPGLSPGSEMGEASNLAACMGGRISGTWRPGRKRGRVGNLFDNSATDAKLNRWLDLLARVENSFTRFEGVPLIFLPRASSNRVLFTLLPSSLPGLLPVLSNVDMLVDGPGFSRSLTHTVWAPGCRKTSCDQNRSHCDHQPGGLNKLAALAGTGPDKRVGPGGQMAEAGSLRATDLDKTPKHVRSRTESKSTASSFRACCTNPAEPSRTGAQASIRPEPVQGPSQSFPQPVPGLVNPAGLAPVPFGLGNLI